MSDFFAPNSEYPPPAKINCDDLVRLAQGWLSTTGKRFPNSLSFGQCITILCIAFEPDQELSITEESGEESRSLNEGDFESIFRQFPEASGSLWQWGRKKILRLQASDVFKARCAIEQFRHPDIRAKDIETYLEITYGPRKPHGWQDVVENALRKRQTKKTVT